MPNPSLQQDLADLRALIARIAHTLDKLSPRERAAIGVQEPLVSQLLQIQNASGQADGISALSQVEQALRESEQREKARVVELETLMDVVPAMIWISRDPQCQEMRGNRYGYEFLKMWERANISKTAPGEALQQQPYRNFKDGREIPPEELPMQIAASTGQPAENYNFDLVFNDGTVRSVLGNVQPLFDESGKPYGAISAFVDVTEKRMHAEFSQAINEIDMLLNSTLDVDQVLRQAVSSAGLALGSGTAALSLREATGWVVSYVHGFSEEMIGLQTDDDQERHAVLAIQTGKPLAITDAFNDERANREHMRQQGIRSLLAVPVLLHEKAIGCISFNYYEKVFEFKQAHIDFATQLAASISLALKNASLVRSLEEEIAYRSQAEQETLSRTVQIELQRRLLEQREQERQSIARDLHDGPLQELIAAEYTLAAISASLADQSLFEDLHEVQDILKSQILALRAFASELRPPALANFGLGKALRSYLDTYQEKYPNLSVRYDEKQEGEMIPQEARLALFRILQESLNNISRHARATAVRVSLAKTQEQAVLEIQDNGVGFEVSEDWLELARNGHLGLVGMRERAEAIGGQIDVCSGKGEGTRIRVSVPMNGAS